MQRTAAKRNSATTNGTSKRHLRDAEGGTLILRGTNVSGAAKTNPNRLPPQGAADFRRMHELLGLNAIRLLVFWDALEPEPGVYDTQYLEAVRSKVRAASDAGLYVVVDLHQDVFGSGFGSAGAPHWAANAKLYDRFEPRRTWWLAYFDAPVMRAFDGLWTSSSLIDALGNAWRMLVRALRDEPSVIAFDLFNEPSCGTARPARFERETLPTAYERLAADIREERSSAYLAIEPIPAASLGARSFIRAPSDGRILYMPHLYPAAVELGLGAAKREDIERIVAQLESDAARMHLPLVIGEVGVRRDVPSAEAYLRDAYDVLDEAQLGAFQWDAGPSSDAGYGLFDREGRPASLARAVARAYPQRIAGEPVTWRWNDELVELDMEWLETSSCAGTTRIAVPAMCFPRGATLSVDGGAWVRVQPPFAEIDAQRRDMHRRASLRRS